MPAPFPLHDAQIHTTLAAIAYAGDTLNGASPSPAELRTAIKEQIYLRPGYATGTDWSMIWGPVETKATDNLAYMAFNKSTRTIALCLRGTTTQTLSRFEDVPTSQTAFPTGNTQGATVSTEFLAGLDRLLSITDPYTKDTIANNINTFSRNNPVARVVVNGHSQGAALVPMMMLALRDGHAQSPKISHPVSGFAIAPPTSGNPAFAQLVNTSLDCWFIVNPLDIVPLGYASIEDVLDKDIPEKPSFGEYPVILAIIDTALLAVDLSKPWAQPAQRHVTKKIQTHTGFFSDIAVQHNHNSYLALLGAPQTDVGDPSPFSVAAIAPISNGAYDLPPR